jgi:hypothetical protein
MSASAMYDAYLLIHPERWPSSDIETLLEENVYEELIFGDFDTRYGKQVMVKSQACRERIVVLDEHGVERLVEQLVDNDVITEDELQDISSQALLDLAASTSQGELVCGVSYKGWSIHQADPREVARAAVKAVGHLDSKARILVGGFARRDCVSRSVKALHNRGYYVAVCDMTTLPLSNIGIEHYAKLA